jgi:hypothetical protein
MPAGAIGACWAAGSWEDTAWEALSWADVVALAFVLDMNSRLYVYRCDYYSVPSGDLTTMATRYLREDSGEYNNRWHRMVQDATDAMT